MYNFYTLNTYKLNYNFLVIHLFVFIVCTNKESSGKHGKSIF